MAVWGNLCSGMRDRDVGGGRVRVSNGVCDGESISWGRGGNFTSCISSPSSLHILLIARSSSLASRSSFASASVSIGACWSASAVAFLALRISLSQSRSSRCEAGAPVLPRTEPCCLLYQEEIPPQPAGPVSPPARSQTLVERTGLASRAR